MAGSFLLRVQHYHAGICCQVKLFASILPAAPPPLLGQQTFTPRRHGMVLFRRARCYSIRAISRVAVARVVRAFRPAVKAPAQLLASAAEVARLRGPSNF